MEAISNQVRAAVYLEVSSQGDPRLWRGDPCYYRKLIHAGLEEHPLEQVDESLRLPDVTCAGPGEWEFLIEILEGGF